MPQPTGWSQHFIDTFKAKYGQAPNYQVPEMAQKNGISESALNAWYAKYLEGQDAAGVKAFLAEGHDKNMFLTALKDGTFTKTTTATAKVSAVSPDDAAHAASVAGDAISHESLLKENARLNGYVSRLEAALIAAGVPVPDAFVEEVPFDPNAGPSGKKG